jgi:hypothetical protein
MSTMPKKLDGELKARAVRLVNVDIKGIIQRTS